MIGGTPCLTYPSRAAGRLTNRPSGAIDRELRADAWQYNPSLERARQLADAGHPIDAGTRLGLAFYERDKAAAKAAGRDVSDPEPEEAA